MSRRDSLSNRGSDRSGPRAASRPPRFEPLEARELLSGVPGPGVDLTLAEVKGVFSQAIARATQLGVNVTISLVDREGNILGVVRMRDPLLAGDQAQSTIVGGGVGGLEGVSLPSSIFATSKAGTAAFLSTRGNAFSTRTAGFIIQENFPAGIRNQPSGPLFGVQLSSLPTSDLNRLPIGLAADPGGLPLYRGDLVVGGIGVEFDGLYTAPSSRFSFGEGATDEERIAAAGLAGFEPPSNIRADNILVAGIRFAFMKTGIPSRDSLGALPDFDGLVAANRVTVLSALTVSPATKFTTTAVGGVAGDTVFGFQQGYVEALAVRGGDAFVVRPNAGLIRQLSRIDIASGATVALGSISGTGANQITPGHRVSAMALDDLGTADTADDLLYVFDADAARLATFSAATGAAISNVPLGSADGVLQDAVVQRSGPTPFIFGNSLRGRELVRVDAGNASSAGGVLRLTDRAAGTIDTFALGDAGLFAVRAGPQGVTTATRELVRVNTDGSGSVLIANISDAGPNEGAVSQPISGMVYSTNGTATPADDVLIAQNSTRGRQFLMTTATGAIGAAPVEIASPAFVLTSARPGPNGTAVGISELTGQLQRVVTANVANAGNLVSLTAVDTSSLTRGGVDAGGAVVLSSAEVETVLAQAHRQNARLRAAIRRDRPQVSQVTVSVVDVRGNLLGVFRTPDAPVFGFDVSLQKARSAMLFSRTDAGALIGSADGGQYAKYADAAAAARVPLNGSVAIADRTIGFISRPTLPDGIANTGPGPFSALAPDVFSPFNTGFQTQLIMPNIFKYAFEFLSVSEADALRLFGRGLIGGGGVSTSDLPLANGLQIFPGAVPLYKGGQLVGAVGVSGDGIEQDDSVAFEGAKGFQQFGSVKRADKVTIIKKLRLPYVKFPRRPTGGF